MKKAIFTLSMLYLAITMAFGQQIEVKLSEDKPSDEKIIDNLCRFSFNKGEAAGQGNTLVSFELENISSDGYIILLFNHSYNKAELRKHRIYLAKGFSGDYVQAIENIDNINSSISIPNEAGIYKYQFSPITIDEGNSREFSIPIHVAKEKNLFLCSKKKKIIEEIHDITIKITVEESDPNYLPLQQQCDSLMSAFNDAIENHVFCTNKLHMPRFEEQIHDFKDGQDYLKQKIHDAKVKLKPKNSKYQKYEDLLSMLNEMDVTIANYRESKYDCGDKTQHKTVHSCKYCKLSLDEIYNILDRYYRNLYNRKVEKKEIWKDVSVLYKCCTDATCAKHASQWRNGGLIKDKIIERYNQIKDFQ